MQGFDNTPGHGKLIINQQLYPFAYGEHTSNSSAHRRTCMKEDHIMLSTHWRLEVSRHCLPGHLID